MEGRCRWWRSGGPLEGPTAPRVLASLFAVLSGIDEVPNQKELAQSEDEGKDGDRHVVLGKATLYGVGVGSTRHTLDTKSVHWPEGSVVGSESNQEVPETKCLVELTSSCFRVPVVDTGEQCEHRTADEHVVEVSDDEVGIVEVCVKTSNWEEHSRDTTECEGDEESKRPQRVGLHDQ